MNAFLANVLGTGFAFLMTASGAGCVFLLKNKISEVSKSILLGIAAGIMLASSVWSLLIPAIEQADTIAYVGAGFIAGVVFMILLDEAFVRFFKVNKKNFLLVASVTIHNIPEGMAIGIAFASAGLEPYNHALFTGAVSLAIGIAVQNFPEGTAVAMPLREEGLGKCKSFLVGCMSGAVEPLFGIGVFIIAGYIAVIMPFLLSFAAGTMMYVIIEEMMPEIHGRGSCRLGTIGVISGFLLMMVLDVLL